MTEHEVGTREQWRAANGGDDAAVRGADGGRPRARPPRRAGPLDADLRRRLLLAWSAAGLVAYALIEGVRSLDLGFLAWDEAGPYVAGGAILAAAVYQLTPAKDACLRRCRDAQAAGTGIEHGPHCVGCCWGLTAALFALGVMSIAWMAFVAALIAAERLLPSRLMANRAAAVVLAVLGLAVAFAPGDVPVLTLPDSHAAAGMTMER